MKQYKGQETFRIDSVNYIKVQDKTRPSTSENRCKLYPPERKLTKANQSSLILEGGPQGEM